MIALIFSGNSEIIPTLECMLGLLLKKRFICANCNFKHLPFDFTCHFYTISGFLSHFFKGADTNDTEKTDHENVAFKRKEMVYLKITTKKIVRAGAAYS